MWIGVSLWEKKYGNEKIQGIYPTVSPGFLNIPAAVKIFAKDHGKGENKRYLFRKNRQARRN